MEESYKALVEILRKTRIKGRKRVEKLAALAAAESIEGPVFGQEGKIVASIIEDAIEACDGEPQAKPKKAKAEDTTNHQAAAGVLKYIADAYQKAFNARFECNYGYHVPMLRRLLDKDETVEGLQCYADAWIAAGKGQLVHGDAYRNARMWGDATVKSFAQNLNQIKSHAKPPKAPAVEWVMPTEATG